MYREAEPGLDLLEKYLKHGQNLTGQQKDRWGGNYPVTVLTEAMQKLHVKLGYKSTIELAGKYPKIPMLVQLEEIVRDIGLEELQTRDLRIKDFDVKYGFPSSQGGSPSGSSGTAASTSSQTGAGTTSNTAAGTSGTQPPQTASGGTTGSSSSSAGSNSSSGSTASSGTRAYAINDEKHVTQTLKTFAPKGTNRQKVVSLRDELKALKIKDNPIAFCLLLRSIFEVSAKVYSTEKSLPLQKSGKDKTLKELLTSIYNHLTTNNSNAGMVKTLYGAHVEISKPSGILSITSMNQLVHNPTFSITPSDICTMFNNIYPLLEAMN